jgi:hypothetical protein
MHDRAQGSRQHLVAGPSGIGLGEIRRSCSRAHDRLELTELPSQVEVGGGGSECSMVVIQYEKCCVFQTRASARGPYSSSASESWRRIARSST